MKKITSIKDLKLKTFKMILKIKFHITFNTNLKKNYLQ